MTLMLTLKKSKSLHQTFCAETMKTNTRPHVNQNEDQIETCVEKPYNRKSLCVIFLDYYI